MCGLAGLWAGMTCTGVGLVSEVLGGRGQSAPSHPAWGARLGEDPERPAVSVSDEAGNPGVYKKSNF